MRLLKINILVIIFIFAASNIIKAETQVGGVQMPESQPMVKTDFKILTLNIHSAINWQGRVDLDGLVAFIREVNPDIVGLQEVERYWGRSGMDLPRELQSRLNMYGAYAISLERAGGYFGNLILSKYPIVQIWTDKMPGYLEPRSYAFIQIIKEGVRINFLTTHLGLSDADRISQTNEILHLINLVDGPVIVTGDFNGVQSDVSVKQFKDSFIDLQESSGNAEKGTFRLKNGFIGPRIDYIFVSPDFNLTRFQIVDNYISDHLPMLAEVSLCVNPANVAGTQTFLQD